ncbi:MAG: hypothetical protein QOF63_3115 [Thermoanaerobaculia bacterium]|jgi:tetratricopeptide (TPR) repeat protein|nr:hypothetical protein [Thermoanaerobaculia bacterium]
MKRLMVKLAALFVFLPAIAFAADDPLAGIGELILSGRAQQARARIVTIRDAYAAQANVSGEATAWLLLGMADMARQDASGARTDLGQATARFTTAGDHFGGWLSLWMLSELEKSEGQFDEALAVHERALDLLEKAADPKSRFSLETSKILGPVFGMPASGLGSLLDHPEIVKPILLRFAEIFSRDGYGAALIEVGQLEKAEEQLTRASALSSLFGGLFDASIASHMGDLRRQQWRLDDARESYGKALDGAKAMPAVWGRESWAELQIVGKLAELEMLSGRVKEALTWNDRALKLVRESSNTKREAGVLEDRGSLLTKAGDFDAALSAYEDALRVAAKSGDVWREASIHSDIGSLYMLQGEYGSAVKHLEKSIALFQTLDGAAYVEGPTWILLAEADMLLNVPGSASDALDNAAALAKKSKFKLAEAMVEMLKTGNRLMSGSASAGEMDAALTKWWSLPEANALMFNEEGRRLILDTLRFNPRESAESPATSIPLPGAPFLKWGARIMEGKILFDRGDYADARKAWQQGLAENPSRDHRAGFLALVGASFLKEGKRDEAIDYFKRAADALEASASDVKVEELLSGYLGSDRRLYFHLLVDMLALQGRGSEAFAQAERARARAFLNSVGNHRFNAERGADPRLVREAEVLRTEIAARERGIMTAQPGEAKKTAADLDRLRALYRTLMIRVKVSNPEYAEMTSVDPLPMETVRRELPADTTLISYFVSPNVVHAWIINRDAGRYVPLALTRTDLLRIVCWAGQFGPPVDARGVKRMSSCGEGATAEEAFQKLIAPLVKDIRTTKLVIVPHGVLHYVPFAALRNRETNRYLIEDYTITYAPSASALRFLRAKESPVDGGTLVLGDPISPLPSVSRLNGAATEAVAVAARLHTTAYLGADARESLLYGLSGKIDLIHLAAHGIYDPINPLFSCIALARDDTHNGSLTVDKILSSVDLTGVNLVVLSACQTAIGARSGGDEVVGLTRALLYAGTPGVLSTLWNIDDEASASLMQEFYSKLASGSSAAEALRAAQLSVLHGEHADPRYWAAFTLNGDPQGRWKIPE